MSIARIHTDLALREMQLRAQFRGGLPFAGFLRQHELIERPQAAGSPEQHCLGFLIDGNVVENLGHGYLKHRVHQRKHPHQEQIGVSVRDFWR